MEDIMLLKFTLNCGKVVELTYEDARKIFTEMQVMFGLPKWTIDPNKYQPGQFINNPDLTPGKYDPVKVWYSSTTTTSDKPAHGHEPING